MTTSTLVNNVKVVSQTVGIGTLTLGANVEGYAGIADLINGSTYSYSVHQDALWEYGRGVYNATSHTLTRNVIKSFDGTSEGTSPVALGPGANIAVGVLLVEDLSERVGIPANFTINSVTELPYGTPPFVHISGTSPNFVLDIGIETGAPGTNGTNGTNGVTPTFTAGTVTPLSPGATPTFTFTGTPPNYVMNLGIPSGATGATGSTGATGTTGATGATPVLSIGTVTSGTAAVTITGTTVAPVLNFTLQTGATGAQGLAGTPGYTSTDTWAHLNAITPSGGAGSTGFAVGPDTGTHTDANGLASVPNTGQFSYQASPAGWIRIGASLAPDQSLANIATERATRLTAAITQAARNSSSVKLLLTKDGAKTYKSGTTIGEIDEIVALIGPVATNVGYQTWNGSGGATPAPPLRPVETTTGLQMHTQTGFVVSGTVIPDMAAYCIDMEIRLPALAGTFADVASMNAAAATYKVGDIVQVTGGPNTNLSPDVPSSYYGSVEVAQNNQTIGYYVRGNTTFGRMSQVYFLSWYDIAYAGASRYAHLYLDNRGQLNFFAYDGTNQCTLRTVLENVFQQGQSSVMHVRLDNDGTSTRLWLNGAQVDEDYSTISFTPTHLFINGQGRATTPSTGTVPVNGLSYELDALCITNGRDYVTKKDITNVIARTYGSPIQKYSETAYVWIHIDQSRTANSGPSTVGDPLRPDPVTNWNGMLSVDATNSGLLVNPTQERIYGVFTFKSASDSDKLGPVHLVANTFGTPTGKYTLSGSGGETIEMGLSKQLKRAPELGHCDLYMVATTYGGYSLDLIKQKSSPPTYLYDLLSKSATGPTAGMQTREQLNRAVMSVQRRCKKQGQTLRIIAVSHLQGETTATASGYTATTMGQAYFDDITDLVMNDLKYIVDEGGPAPWVFKKQLGWASDGVSNSYNQTPAYYDDQYRRLEASRTTTFRYSISGNYASRFGRWIHPMVLAQRQMGEIYGDMARRTYFEQTWDGRAFQVVSAVRSGSNIVLTCNGPLAVRDTNSPIYQARHTTGGFDTFGVVFEPISGGRTINGNVTWANSGPGGVGVITVPISGGGPIANDRINITGTNAYYTNFWSATTRTGLYPSMNWPSVPFASSAPPIDPTGPLNDLTEPLAVGSYVLT